MWEGEVLKALLLHHRFDIVLITLGNWIKTYHGARSSDGLVNGAWVVLYCNRRIGAGTETADTTCALSGSISGAGKSIEIRLRMCGPPLY